MRTAKKLTAILLALTLILALAACGGGNDAPQSDNKNPDNPPPTGDNTPDTDPDEPDQPEEPEHVHTWVDATCTAPKTCSECGETEGEALGHTWTDATCTAPKTCSVCGVTEGDPLGHSFVPTTDDNVVECERCGRIEGNPEVDGIVWYYENDTLTVSGQGPMPDYYGDVYAPWYMEIARGKMNVSLVIEDGFTTVGAYAFYGFDGLISVKIPDGVTAIKEGAFSFVSGLENLTVPDSVTSIEKGAFQKCTRLKELTIPAGVTEIGDGIIAGDTLIKTVRVAEGNSSFVAVDNVIFTADMTRLVAFPSASLDQYTVPDGVTTISAQTFMYSFVDDVTVPEGVTTIGSRAFYYSSIKSVTLPASLTLIGEYCFYSCGQLTDIYFAGTAEQWAAISANASVPENVTVHYGA